MCFLGYLGGADPDGLGPRVKIEKMRKLFKFEIISLEHYTGTKIENFMIAIDCHVSILSNTFKCL